MEMKDINKKILIWLGIIFSLVAFILFVFDVIIMPQYVNSPEVVVPSVIGLHKDRADELLSEAKLNAVFEGPRSDEKIAKDHVIFQKPAAGTLVKENRRIFIHISDGNYLTRMPDFLNKSLRDATTTIERMGFVLSEIEEVTSELEAKVIVDQFPSAGTNLKKGTKIKLQVSIGPTIGMVRVPDLLGLSYKEALNLLESNSLEIGKLSYESSKNLLPNTVVAQFPSKNTLINIGESVDLFITKN